MQPQPADYPRRGEMPASWDASHGIASPDPLDEAVLRLAAQATFLQAFAEALIEEERPVEELLAQRGSAAADFGWRAGLQW